MLYNVCFLQIPKDLQTAALTADGFNPFCREIVLPSIRREEPNISEETGSRRRFLCPNRRKIIKKDEISQKRLLFSLLYGIVSNALTA